MSSEPSRWGTRFSNTIDRVTNRIARLSLETPSLFRMLSLAPDDATLFFDGLAEHLKEALRDYATSFVRELQGRTILPKVKDAVSKCILGNGIENRQQLARVLERTS
ncbi:MAG: hypothetical protein ACOC38_12595 [Promethearchaeia archaeon]